MTYFLTGLPIPKLLNELLSLFVGIQVRKRATFFRRNDVNGIICEPINGHSQEVDESPLLRHSVVQNRHEAVSAARGMAPRKTKETTTQRHAL